MLWEPTISPTDPAGIVQLKTLLGQIVKALRANKVMPDNITTSLSDNVLSAIGPAPDWVVPTSIVTGATYADGLYLCRVWQGPLQFDSLLAGTDYQLADQYCRFVAGGPTTVTDLAAFQAIPHQEDVAATGEAANVQTVWVVAPTDAWGSGTYVSVNQDGGFVRLTPPSSGNYFLASIDGEIAWIEAGLCTATTTTTTTTAA